MSTMRQDGAPETGPSVPENDAGSTPEEACSVADATSSLNSLLVVEEDPSDVQKMAKKSAGDPAALALLPTAKKSAGDPAASTPSMTPILRDDEEDASSLTDQDPCGYREERCAGNSSNCSTEVAGDRLHGNDKHV